MLEPRTCSRSRLRNRFLVSDSARDRINVICWSIGQDAWLMIIDVACMQNARIGNPILGSDSGMFLSQLRDLCDVDLGPHASGQVALFHMARDPLRPNHIMRKRHYTCLR